MGFDNTGFNESPWNNTSFNNTGFNESSWNHGQNHLNSSSIRSYPERSPPSHACTPARITAIVLAFIAIAVIVGTWVGLRCGPTGAWASTGVAMALLLVSSIIGIISLVSCRKSSESSTSYTEIQHNSVPSSNMRAASQRDTLLPDTRV